VHGVSTRSVDELVQALGCTGIDKSTVSRLCTELDEEAQVFRGRPLEGEVPYVWLDRPPLREVHLDTGTCPVCNLSIAGSDVDHLRDPTRVVRHSCGTLLVRSLGAP